MLCTRVHRDRDPHPVSSSVGGGGSGVRGFVVLGVCGTRVRSSVCRTTMTVTNRLRGAWERHVPPLRAVEETLHGTNWNMISPLLTTDDAGKVQDCDQSME